MSFPNVQCAPLPALGAKFNVPCRYLVFFFRSFRATVPLRSLTCLYWCSRGRRRSRNERNKLPFCYFASVFVFFLGSVGLLAASRDDVCYIVYHSLIHPFLSSHQPMTIYQTSAKVFWLLSQFEKNDTAWHLLFSNCATKNFHWLLTFVF